MKIFLIKLNDVVTNVLKIVNFELLAVTDKRRRQDSRTRKEISGDRTKKEINLDETKKETKEEDSAKAQSTSQKA
ncbi:hypothetical protein LSTR_LSTR000309 [Laodelphax striatellus]|uniref:Uncharacterized protein n=1 Tax=Laodelphax striatellus TaxID=195883 RepID=A0A482X6Q4_LAOST|nr:hypothetical protein LSTR_LSTR000309 [Laodelphax striatellus]